MKSSEMIQAQYNNLYRFIYDEEFCKALDEGREMYQAAEAGDQAILQTIVNIQGSV